MNKDDSFDFQNGYLHIFTLHRRHNAMHLEDLLTTKPT